MYLLAQDTARLRVQRTWQGTTVLCTVRSQRSYITHRVQNVYILRTEWIRHVMIDTKTCAATNTHCTSYHGRQTSAAPQWLQVKFLEALRLLEEQPEDVETGRRSSSWIVLIATVTSVIISFSLCMTFFFTGKSNEQRRENEIKRRELGEEVRYCSKKSHINTETAVLDSSCEQISSAANSYQ